MPPRQINIEWHHLPAPPFPVEGPEDEEDEIVLPFKDKDGKELEPWVMSKPGTALYEEMGDRAEHCDPDREGLYIYNDFLSYGLLEVLETAVVPWMKEWKKKRAQRRPEQLWFHIESLVGYLHGGNDCWYMADCGERVEKLIEVMSSMITETFRILAEENLFTPTSPILNITLVAAMALHWSPPDDSPWVPGLKKFLHQHNIIPSLGPPDLLEKMGEKGDRDFLEGWEKEEEMESVDMKALLKEYEKECPHSIGGNRYDLRKMSTREKAKYSLDREVDIEGDELDSDDDEFDLRG